MYDYFIRGVIKFAIYFIVFFTIINLLDIINMIEEWDDGKR